MLIPLDQFKEEHVNIPLFTLSQMCREQKITAYKSGREWLVDPEEAISDLKKYSNHTIH